MTSLMFAMNSIFVQNPDNLIFMGGKRSAIGGPFFCCCIQNYAIFLKSKLFFYKLFEENRVSTIFALV